MRIRPWLVGAAAAASITATPAAATHMPYYLNMGIIEISSAGIGTTVTYSLSGFAPTDWSTSCSISPLYNAFGAQTTTVSCTPPPPPEPFDVNYCAFLTVTVSSVAPPISPGTATGTSACSGAVATASTPAGGANGSGTVGLRATFAWTCTATAPPTLHPWTVRCTVSH